MTVIFQRLVRSDSSAEFLSVPQVAVWLPNGMVQMPNSTVHMPDGSVQLMDGRLMHPDGAIVKPRPDGSFDLKDGTTLLPVRPPPLPQRSRMPFPPPPESADGPFGTWVSWTSRASEGGGGLPTVFCHPPGRRRPQLDGYPQWGGACVARCPASSQNGVIRLADGLLKYPNQAVAC